MVESLSLQSVSRQRDTRIKNTHVLRRVLTKRRDATQLNGTVLLRCVVDSFTPSDATHENWFVASRRWRVHTKRRQATRRNGTELFRWVALRRVVSRSFGVNTLTTQGHWWATDLVGFSSSRRILNISESVAPSRAQLLRVFRCERAGDCDPFSVCSCASCACVLHCLICYLLISWFSF